MKYRAALATRAFTPEPIPAAFRNHQLAKALERAGIRTTVLTTKAPQGRGERDRGISTISRFPVKRDHQGQVRGYASYLSFDIPLFFRLLAMRKPDVFIAEPPPTTGLVTMIAAAIKRVPYAFYAADVWCDATESVEGVPWIVRTVVREMEKLVWNRADVVLTISDGVNDRIKELIGDKPQLEMIANGIDTETFTPDGPVAEEQGPYFVYAGTVSEWQGADILVDAFAKVRDRHPAARLLFFSEGSGKDALQQAVEKRGITGIEFRGKVPAATVAKYLRGAVAGLSSITPGIGYDFALPTKIYAAGACGTPIIHAGAKDSAATLRIVNNQLGFAPGYDAAALADSMESALEQHDHVDRTALRQWTVDNASLQAAADRGAARIARAIAKSRS